jgi:23S rRNA maturation-related 3'-5' exoribonuclease YhaM
MDETKEAQNVKNEKKAIERDEKTGLPKSKKNLSMDEMLSYVEKYAVEKDRKWFQNYYLKHSTLEKGKYSSKYKTDLKEMRAGFIKHFKLEKIYNVKKKSIPIKDKVYDRVMKLTDK